MKKIFNSRSLALILVLAMAVSLLTISASAVTNVSLTGHGSNIASIVATGADFEEIDYAVSTDMHGTVYDYYLTVPADTADGTALTASGIQPVTIPKNTATDVVVTGGSNSHIYINNAYGTGTATNSFTLARHATQIVRVIVQDNTTAQPYVGYVMLKGGK